MRKTATGVLVIFMCLFMFVGCYTGKTLEERIPEADRQTLIASIKADEGFKEFSDVTMEIEENHITFKAYFGISLDQLQIIQLKSEILQTDTSSKMEKIKKSIEKTYKIRPSMITLEFYAADSRFIGKVEG